MFIYYLSFILFSDEIMGSIIVINSSLYSDAVLVCEPNKIYKARNVNCICNQLGEWSNEYCRSYFQKSLKLKQDCDPNKYIIKDCNVCRCGPDGKIDPNKCTKHVCKKAVKETRKSNSGIDSCKPNNWYSLSPCRLCYCLKKHKLICNNYETSPKVQLGKYKLNSCGENFIKDIQDLISANSKLLKSSNRISHQKKRNKKKKLQTYEENGIDTETITPREYEYYNNSKKGKKYQKIKTTEKLNKQDSGYNDDYKSKSTKKAIHKYNSENILTGKGNEEMYDDTIDLNEDEVENSKLVDNNNRNFFKEPEADLYMAKNINWEDENSQKNISNANILRVPLPDILNDFLQLVIRKSMVSIDSSTKCKPGTSIKIECNTCFCLANGKTLCTKKICK